MTCARAWNRSGERKKITLTRKKSTTEIKAGRCHGKRRTIQVEVRKKRCSSSATTRRPV